MAIEETEIRNYGKDTNYIFAIAKKQHISIKLCRLNKLFNLHSALNTLLIKVASQRFRREEFSILIKTILCTLTFYFNKSKKKKKKFFILIDPQLYYKLH